jgi:hypothetical protein
VIELLEGLTGRLGDLEARVAELAAAQQQPR